MVHELESMRTNLLQLKERIKEEYNAEIIGIFGSYVRGEQKTGSDLDILARFGKGASLFDLAGLSLFLKEELKIPVDVVSEKAIRKEFRKQFYEEVVTL
jgi:hypothetical protein